MGFAISWLAVNGKSPEAIDQELGLTPTGEMTDPTLKRDVPQAARPLP